MRPTLGCGHTEYDRGHCGQPGCANDYFVCADCCPLEQMRPGARKRQAEKDGERGAWDMAPGYGGW